MKRFLAIILSVLMVLTAVNFSAFSAVAVGEKEHTSEALVRSDYEAFGEIAPLSASYLTDNLKDYIAQEIAKCTSVVDVSAYKIPYSAANGQLMAEYVYNELIEAFHVSAISYSYTSKYITRFTFNYGCTISQYNTLLSKTKVIAESMVADIRDSGLSQAEMALVLHDRLALHCKYDYEFESNDTSLQESKGIYGAFVEGEVICQGYARAYKYLLSYVGIDSYLCTSDRLNHMWNIVYIDNKPYHVDVTWDDPSSASGYNPLGRVYHDNFLLSTNALYNGVNGSDGHTATDYDSTPTDTTYDSYCWQTSHSAVQYINDRIYYIDNENSALKQLGASGSLCSVNDMWPAGEYSYWRSNFARLAGDGKSLFYSLSDTIYKYDVSSNTNSVLYEPDLSEGNYYSIHGLEYKDGYIYYDLTNDANFADLTNVKRHSFVYDDVLPTASIMATNNQASKQTLKFTFSDNLGIAGYYWGTSQYYGDNLFTVTSDTTVYTDVVESGTYYLVVKDTAGNLSSMYGVTFYKTTLNANGGTVSPQYIITAKGNVAALPQAQNGTVEFLGWSKNIYDTQGVDSITPQSDDTYYAIWKQAPVVLSSVSINTEPYKTVYFTGESLSTSGLSLNLTYSDGSKETIYYDFMVSGFDSSTAGVKTITVSYGGFDVYFNIEVKDIEVVSLQIRSLPDKTEYIKGDILDTTGLELIVKFNNNTAKNVDSGFTTNVTSLDTLGTQLVYVYYGGMSVCFTVKVEDLAVTELSVISSPDKIEYFVGDTIDTKGLTLCASYNNGDIEVIDNGYTLSLTTLSLAGEQEIIVEYKGCTTAFVVNVKELEVDFIRVLLTGTKTEYFVGDEIDYTGVQLLIRYNNGENEKVTENLNFSEPDMSTSGRKTVYVYYEDLIGNFYIQVYDIVPESMEINTYPDKTEYFTGNNFDPAGLTLCVNYNNGTQEIIESGFEVTGFESKTAGTKTLTVTYGNMSVNFEVTVKAPELIAITVLREPDKTVYYVGEELDTTGLELKATFDSGDTVIVTEGLEIKGLVFDKPGKTEISLDVNGFEVSFFVDVLNNPEIATTVESTQVTTTETSPEKTTTVTNVVTEPTESAVATTIVTEPTESGAATTIVTEPTESGAATTIVTEPTESTVVTTFITEPTETTQATTSDVLITEPEESTSATETQEVTETTTEITVIVTTTAAETQTQPITTEPLELKIGDVNFDNKVNIKDVTAIQKHLAKIIVFSDEALKVADFDRNGKVNIKDATAIQKFLVGLY